MKSLHSALLLVSALSFGACNSGDDDVQNVAPSGPYTSLSAVLNDNSAPAQTFSIDAETGGTFVAARGTRFLFPAQGFVFPNGSAVRGTVQVTVQEFLDRGELLFSRVLPVSGGTPLLTGGAVFASAVQSNRAVQVKASTPYTVYLPQRNFIAPAASLQPYYGTQADAYISNVRWVGSPRPATIAASAADTISMTADTLGYQQPAVPADFFGSSVPTPVTIKFSLGGPAGLNETNSYLYLLPVGARQVIPIGAAGETLKKASYTATKDRKFNLVAVGVVNGYFYGAIVTDKVEDGKTYSVNLAENLPSVFKAAVTALL